MANILILSPMAMLFAAMSVPLMKVAVSIMAQYYPAHRAPRIPLLARKITTREYEEVVGLLDELGIENGWIQEIDASDTYRPDFQRQGHPFEPALSRRE